MGTWQSFLNLSLHRNADDRVATLASDVLLRTPFAGLPAPPAASAPQLAHWRAWREYFAWRRGFPAFKSVMEGLWMHSAAALSAPLSALAALHAARGGAWLNAAARLTLHVVYATPEDIIGVECYEELLHLLPNLRELRVLISGPESQFYVEGVQFRPAGTCGNCSGAGKRRFLALARGEYEEVMNEPEVRRGGAPDLVMALNAAVYQQHVKGAVTVALALSGGAPLLLTSYAADSASAEREFVEVVAKTARLPLRVAQPTALNPWASPCLKQDTCAGADELVEGAGVLRSGLAEARELTLERFYTSNSYVHTVVLAEGGGAAAVGGGGGGGR